VGTFFIFGPWILWISYPIQGREKGMEKGMEKMSRLARFGDHGKSKPTTRTAGCRRSASDEPAEM
jgi:hypothetical protein